MTWFEVDKASDSDSELAIVAGAAARVRSRIRRRAWTAGESASAVEILRARLGMQSLGNLLAGTQPQSADHKEGASGGEGTVLATVCALQLKYRS